MKNFITQNTAYNLSVHTLDLIIIDGYDQAITTIF